MVCLDRRRLRERMRMLTFLVLWTPFNALGPQLAAAQCVHLVV